MPKLKLTDRYVSSVKAAPGQRLEFFDQDVRGLILRVSSVGRKSWVFRYRTEDGMQRRHALGIYLDGIAPQMGDDDDNEDAKLQVLTLAEARATARVLINDLGKGRDPSAAREARLAKAKAEPLKTMNDLKDAYFVAVEIGEWRPREKIKKKATILREKQMWGTYIESEIGDLRVEAASPDSIKKLLRAIVAKGNGTTSNRVRALLRQIFNFAVHEDRIAISPVSKVKSLAPEKARERVITDGELTAIWRVLNSTDGIYLPTQKPGDKPQKLYVGLQVRIALKLLALTLTRRAEVAAMAVDEIDFDRKTWTIPGARTKNGKSLLVPLTDPMISLIREAMALRQGDAENSLYVFSSPWDWQKPLTENPISHGMRDVTRALGIPNARLHDLRRTGASNMVSERLKIPPYIIGRILNHTNETGGAAQVTMEVYALHEQAEAKRAALNAWNNLLLEIVGERKVASNVIQLQGA